MPVLTLANVVWKRIQSSQTVKNKLNLNFKKGSSLSCPFLCSLVIFWHTYYFDSSLSILVSIMDKPSTVVTEAITILVRLVGLTVLLVGLYVGIKVIFEAWQLYEEPQRIERFATAIEQGSQLDSLLSSLANKSPEQEAISDQTITPQNQTKPVPVIRLTYFLAWGIAVLLLMVVGSLASTAIKTGGQLALYDQQVKQLAKQLKQQIQSAADN